MKQRGFQKLSLTCKHTSLQAATTAKNQHSKYKTTNNYTKFSTGLMWQFRSKYVWYWL